MSAARAMFGAALGATVASVAVRVTNHAKRRKVSPIDALSDLPELLAEDAKVVASAARGAFADGQRAAERARIEFDMQVVAHARRNRSADD